MRKRFGEVDWDLLLSSGAEDGWNRFKLSLLNIEKDFALKYITATGKYKKAIWMTNSAVRSARRKHKLFRK
jgi:hypothetical protein